jgi:hypothetical protein
MKRLTVATFLIVLFNLTPVHADKGMWLFNAFPKDKVKAKYGWAPDDQWLDHLRLATVRIGATGSFVSPDGLVFTNHHVGAGCVHDLSVGGKDYMKDGFYARTREQEAPCPGVELNVLQAIEDVTAKVSAAERPGMTAAQAGQARRAAQSAIEKECSVSGLKCEVVTLYAGAMYHLYKYKKYTDVRLVFAPEGEIAFFGGDPDNFTYPRYDLDITFLRVYQDAKPVKIGHYLKWSKKGVQEGDLVFVSGHPGSTGRLNTMAQMEFLRDVAYPYTLANYQRRIELLQRFGDESPENARIAERTLFRLQNSFKAVTGYRSGLLDKTTMARKAADEKALRTAIAKDPKKQAEFGDPWADIEKGLAVQRQIYVEQSLIEGTDGFTGSLASYARTLVRVGAERQKPNGERLREYRDSALPTLETRLFSTAPIYKALETVVLADSLAFLQQKLGADHPVVKKVLNGKPPADVAKAAIAGTKLNDIAFRRELYQGGAAAVQASTDSLIAIMRAIDPEARTLRTRLDDEVSSVQTAAGARIAKALFAEKGMSMPPDATGTLRLNYGVVKGYVEKGKQIPFATTIGGAFAHAEKHGSQPPYRLPESWIKAKSMLDLKAPLNHVNTADSIGGNSGSPAVNKNGEVVGILFDGNMQALPWRFMYEDVIGRSVCVDSRGVIETLRKIYGADALVDELLGAPAKTKAGGVQ